MALEKRVCAAARWTWSAVAMALLLTASIWSVAVAAQDAATPPTSLAGVLPADATGEQIYNASCTTCHAPDGTGASQQVVGFALPLANGHGFPDFTDCPTNTVEPAADWVAVATRGGPVRGLDRHMPAFGDALSGEQLQRVIDYVRSFCQDRAWPRGDLNFPRAFFTEKAFPENESVWTTGLTSSGQRALTNELVYEHRLGARSQYEVKIPLDAQQAGGGWVRGLGDVEVALRRTVYADYDRGAIAAAGAAVVFPTGKEERGLGNGFMVYEPFAMYGQMLGANGHLQLHGGYEIPSDSTRGTREAFLRTTLGYTLAQDHGFGRAWSPMAEVLVARPQGGAAEWDVVPQVQVSLSKLQHILIDVGVRVPLNERDERRPQLLTYFLWDWFDGGLFQFWK